MECQLFVGQLPMLFEERAAQNGFCRQTFASSLLQPATAKVGRDPLHQLAMLIKPCRYGLELSTQLVVAKDIEYAALDDAFLTHCRLRRLLIVPCSQWFESTA